MQLSKYLLLAFLSFGLLACGSDPEPAQTATPTAPALAPALQTAPQMGATAALNPAHGQPGHNCAIAVGAPLDGSGAPQQAPQIDMSKMSNGVVQPNSNTTTATPAASTGNASTVALNPAHGQPGHNCAIAVGAPLN